MIYTNFDVTLEIAKKAFPLFMKGDCGWYDFVDDQYGIPYFKPHNPEISYLETQQIKRNQSHAELIEHNKTMSSYFDMIREFKSSVRRLYNPIDDLKVGDGATVAGYSDRRAGTVISRTAKTITIQRDKSTLLNKEDLKFHIGGFSANCSNQNVQQYKYERDENGSVEKFSRRKDGSWRSVGCQHVTNRYNDIYVGRHEFYDFNF